MIQLLPSLIQPLDALNLDECSFSSENAAPSDPGAALVLEDPSPWSNL